MKKARGKRVFISYAREDLAEAEKIYKYLSDGDFDAWMDVHDIVSGNDWLKSITKAIKESDYFLACLSHKSVGKPGILEEELNLALDICRKIPDPDIFLIPVRLEDCPIPERISQYQWVDLFAEDGWMRLSRALNQKRKKSRKLRWGAFALGMGLLASLSIVFWNGLFPSVEVDYSLVDEICDTTDSTIPVKVGISLPADNCPLDYQDSLAREWASEITEVTRLDNSIQFRPGSQEFSGFDLIVWDSCEEDFTLNFKLVTSRSPVEVYEPESLQATGSMIEMAGVGNALIHYQRGDYEEAARQFASLGSTKTTPEQAVLWANSLLFDGKYDDDIIVLKENVLDDLPGAAYNNLGVARFNMSKLLEKPGSIQTGLFEFEQAIELAEEQNDNELAILAYTNRSTLYRQAGNWTDAMADCESAMVLDSKSALPYLCRVRYYFARYTGSQNEIPLDSIDRDLTLAERYQSQLPINYYYRGLWQEENKQYTQALAFYKQYFELMRNQACLQTDRLYLRDATISVNELR